MSKVKADLEIIIHLFRDEDRAFYNFDERLMEFKVHDL